jgi:predicted Fe-Mo cluster-binding NifX family protein
MEGHNGSEEINLAMIATYPELSRVLAEITKGMNIRLNNIFASFKEAAALAGEIEDKPDIILSRGGTAQYIKDAVSIPVISIPITPFDLASSISSLPEKYKEIAFLNYHRKLFGVRDIERMFSKRIREYTFANRTDIADAVKDAKEKGVEVVVGGDLGAHMATELGMVGVEIFSGREAVYQSLMEAMELIRVQRIERARHVRIKVAFDSIAEGIVIADENKAVTICNSRGRADFQPRVGQRHREKRP